MNAAADTRKTEDAIIEAGIRVFLTNPGAGMSEVARVAGVGRATLYRHFSSQEELMRRLALVCVAETSAAVEHLGDLQGLEALGASIDCLMPVADRFILLSTLWSFAELDEDVSFKIGQLFNGLSDIVEQGKAQKIIVFKYKRRKRYRRKQGHRQMFTAVKIDSIRAN